MNMSNLHKTSRGAIIDIDRLKLANENVIAVGNSGQNVRGDLVKGNKVIKSREQIMQETYNLSGNNVVRDVKNKNKKIQPDDVGSVMMNPYEQVLSETNETKVVAPATSSGSPRGGLANAVQKSADINAVLDAQRKRI
jgi:hypothetical protein